MNENQSFEVVLDVREDLKAGREPFSKIMAAAESVPVGGSLTLYATFKPTPLLAVLDGQGFESEAIPIEDGDWQVVFRRNSAAPGGSPDLSTVQSAAEDGLNASEDQSSKDIELDNRGLEPPEPMVRTLEAINTLEPGDRIVGRYDRQPMFLLPRLEQMGYTYDVTLHDDGSATVVIKGPQSQ